MFDVAEHCSEERKDDVIKSSIGLLALETAVFTRNALNNPSAGEMKWSGPVGCAILTGSELLAVTAEKNPEKDSCDKLESTLKSTTVALSSRRNRQGWRHRGSLQTTLFLC